MMKPRLIVTLLSLICAFVAIAQPSADGQFLDDTRDYLGRLEKLGFAGVVLVARDGTPLVAEGYGLADRELLGAIIEKLSGGSFEQHMRERLFVPLAMYETGYVLASWGDGRLAQGYRGAELWGTTVGRPMADDGPYWVLRANGGIHSTAWDMLRWSRALLEGRVLSAESRKLLWAPHVAEGEGADTFYGYGWSVQEHGGMKVVTHNGSNGVFYADLALMPSDTSLLS